MIQRFAPLPFHSNCCSGDGFGHINADTMDAGDYHERKRKQNTMKSSRIDHTYYDYSTRHLSELLPPEKMQAADDKKGRVTFPMKLHGIVSSPKYRHIICWMPHGRSWKILDKDLLASVVCRENFNHENFDSINRSINGWGFKRLMRAGPDHKSYYHELFLRGRPDLAQAMTRLINPGKRIPDPKGEPDFYEIAKRFPLPADPHDVNQTDKQYSQRMPLPAQVPYNPPVQQNYAQAQPQHHDNVAYMDFPPTKRQRQEPHPHPPAQPARHAQFGPPGFAQDYGYGHYPSYPYPYPPPYQNPYNYAAGSYGEQYGHQHYPNPYGSPGGHFSQHHAYGQHWHQQPHHHHAQYPYGTDNVNLERRELPGGGHEEHKQQPDPKSQMEDTRGGSSKQYASQRQEVDPSAAVKARSPTHFLPPVIHQGSATYEGPANANAYDPHPNPHEVAKHQYIFPSYAATTSKSPQRGYQYPASTDALKSTTEYKSESSHARLEQPRKSSELDDRKPAANRSPTTPARARGAPDISMTPMRTNQRLEWTESFSSDVCNYLLEDDAPKSAKKDDN